MAEVQVIPIAAVEGRSPKEILQEAAVVLSDAFRYVER